MPFLTPQRLAVRRYFYAEPKSFADQRRWKGVEVDELESIFDLETFEQGGRDLFAGLHDDRDPADVQALVVELCRVKDRLDRLHRMASRDDREWGRLLPRDGREGEFVLEVGGVLREQRQTEVVFKQIMAEISRRRSEYDDGSLDDAGGLADL